MSPRPIEKIETNDEVECLAKNYSFHVDIDGICLKCPILPNCVKDMEVCAAVDDGDAVDGAQRVVDGGRIEPGDA